MKRKILSMLLVCALLAALTPLPAAADSTGLCYTAVNDQLLDLNSAAVNYSGVLFVPAQAYSVYGISYNYFSANRTGMLNNGGKQVFFDLNTGNSYDSYGNSFGQAGIFHNGQVYVPVEWTSHYFGLSYSYISGNGYGDVVRIKNGNAVLTDANFINAAKSQMKVYYNEYYPPAPTPTPTPAQTEPAQSSPEESGSPGTLTLCFIGMPDAGLLNRLAAQNWKACFFLTADEVNAAPDFVRRIVCAGQGIAVYCKSKPETECAAAAAAVYAAAQIRPILLTSPASISKACAEFAKVHGYAYYTQRNPVSSAAAILSKLKSNAGRVTVTLTCGSGTDRLIGTLLQDAAAEEITVLPLLETDV